MTNEVNLDNFHGTRDIISRYTRVPWVKKHYKETVGGDRFSFTVQAARKVKQLLSTFYNTTLHDTFVV